jgi:hypothetical protein
MARLVLELQEVLIQRLLGVLVLEQALELEVVLVVLVVVSDLGRVHQCLKGWGKITKVLLMFKTLFYLIKLEDLAAVLVPMAVLVRMVVVLAVVVDHMIQLSNFHSGVLAKTRAVLLSMEIQGFNSDVNVFHK